MAINHITDFTNIASGAGEAHETPAQFLLSGTAATRSWDVYSDARVNCGIWESEPFSKIKTHPTSMEYCYLLEGQVKLTDSRGLSQVFKAGDAFVVKPGFNGTWESLTKVRKHYVICAL